ncbi:hypothetical protein BCR32DRAFT_297680 [Anaeromyces robustus]|uniref:Carbohydrate binding module family 25 domain-containing protein n=1 Tax=Anaeromyces robustus TaxID=1754192 RepID=A0A1Y1VWH6_9FUNG|nr:hypothetical protein BCR32DRAFT_297680 [Anaeromyces robustus]|eukprot:ORX65642.1 hypothetical protein BCR32DRAFT_297680 [Anaeromyces robustus]
MKFINSFLVFCTLFISQTFLINASPIKRTPPSFELQNTAIYFKKPDNWNNQIYAYIYSNNSNNVIKSEWPGFSMRSIDDGYYSLVLQHKYFPDFKVIFTDGQNQVPGVNQEGFVLTMDAVYNQTGIIGISYNKPYFYYNKSEKLAYGNIAKVYYRPSHKGVDLYLKDMYAHFKIGSGEWNNIPGELMEYDPYTMFYTITIDLGKAESITLTFTDGEGYWDNNNEMNYEFKKFSNFFIDNY